MTDIIFDVFTYLMAFYGLFSIILTIIKKMSNSVSDYKNIELVLVERDQEKRIEGIVNNVYTGEQIKKMISDGNFTIIDMGSVDETFTILEKLKQVHPNLKVLNENNKDKIFEKFK